jgi:hypothetical protein
MTTTLTFLQLSDVHFRSLLEDEEVDDAEADGNALDYSLRELLIDDARDVVEGLGGATGVLICGDVADAGNGSEFTQAGTWLQNLCTAIGVPPWLVWSVPGNHDVNRSRIGDLQSQLRTRIRSASEDDVAHIFETVIRNSEECSALLEPFHNYLEFASAYDCMFGSQLHWDDKFDVAGKELRLRGLMSAILCGKGDNTSTNRSLIGDVQATLPQDPDVIHYTLCHHPQPWLMDRLEIEELIAQTVTIRVTGHLHVRKFEDTPAGVYLKAGAVSPKRGSDLRFEGPEVPRYEIISLAIDPDADPATLEVFIAGRIWDESTRQWGPDAEEDGNVGRHFILGDNGGPGGPVSGRPTGTTERLVRPRRELRYRLAQLQPYDRIECARKIGAPLDQIIQAPSYLQVEELFSWADPDSLAPLWTAVAEVTPEIDTGENPF